MTQTNIKLINEIKNDSKKFWNRIPNKSYGEVAITQSILDSIIENSKYSSFISYKNEYREQGKRGIRNKKIYGTSADFVICIKDINKKTHYLAFQAKIGKVYKNDTNLYEEITHHIGSNNTKPFQIDEFFSFLNENKTFGLENGYYLFYNGNYPEKDDSNITNCESFWMLNIVGVREIMLDKGKCKGKNKYENIDIDDINYSQFGKKYKNFVEFLKQF